jgi:hypothetical protein
MILLDDIVEIPATSYHDGTPRGILLLQNPQCPMTCSAAVDIHLAGPARLMGLQGLTEERSGCRLAAIRAQERFDGLAVFVDGPVEVMRTAAHRNRRLVHPPG